MFAMIQPPTGKEEEYYGGYAAQIMWRPMQDKQTGLVTIVPHVSDAMGVLQSMCQIAELVYEAEREYGTMPRTQDMKELQYVADSMEMWDRDS